jgi:DNA-binding NtrC family response regulator
MDPVPGKGVLVVDEEPAILSLLRQVLSEHGFNVYPASSSSEALALCRQHQPRVALVELDLSETDSLQLIADLRGIQPSLQFCLTGAGGPHSSTDWEGLPVFQFFSKPFTLQQLVQAIDDVCSRTSG